MIFFYSKLIMKIMKTGLKSKLRGKAVRLLDIYSLALAETSAWLKKTPPHDFRFQQWIQRLESIMGERQQQQFRKPCYLTCKSSPDCDNWDFHNDVPLGFNTSVTTADII